MSVFTCVWRVCEWMCEGVCMERAGTGGWARPAGVCCLHCLPLGCQCGVMSALRLFSRQGSYWKHTLLLRRPISAVTHRAEASGAGATACQCRKHHFNTSSGKCENNNLIVLRLRIPSPGGTFCVTPYESSACCLAKVTQSHSCWDDSPESFKIHCFFKRLCHAVTMLTVTPLC